MNFTPQQQLENTKLALRLWKERVTQEMVVSELDEYHCFSTNSCGYVACFGGHLTTWPEFHALGVRNDPQFYPVLGEVYAGRNVSRQLFGNSNLFNCVEDGEYFKYGLSRGDDYNLVVMRLDSNIRTLEKTIKFLEGSIDQ